MNEEWRAMTQMRPLLVGFPKQTRRALAADLRQWTMETASADTIQAAVAKLREAMELGRPYRVALVYVQQDMDMVFIAKQLRSDGRDNLAIIQCSQRDTFDIRTSTTSVIALPPDKSLLYNALHAALEDQELSPGIASLSDRYLRRRAQARCYHILVAEDNQINRKIIAKQLESAGHIVRLVADGEQALDALSDPADRYDVIILDSNMPVMNGLQATRLIRVMGAGRCDLPIIMISAERTRKAIREATKAGVNVFLPKPLETMTLLSTIEQICEKRNYETAKVLQIKSNSKK